MGQHHRERGPAALVCPHFNVFKFTTANIAGTDFQSPPPVSTYIFFTSRHCERKTLWSVSTHWKTYGSKKSSSNRMFYKVFLAFCPVIPRPLQIASAAPHTHNWSNTSSLTYKTLFYIHCIFLFEKAAARSQFVFLFKITFGCKSEMSLSTQEGEKEQQIVLHVQKVTNNKNPLCRVVSITCVRVNTSL